MKNPIKLAMLCTAVCAAMLAFNSNARADATLTTNTTDPQALGDILPGIPTGDADITQYVNAMINLSPGGSTTVTINGQTNAVNRFALNSGVPSGTLPGAVLSTRGGATDAINLGTTAGVYLYLFAKYDGPNQGSFVWYVGNLVGAITIPSTWGGYGLSGWALFTGPGGPVPDGGTTVMLLGAALGALGMARRYLKS